MERNHSADLQKLVTDIHRERDGSVYTRAGKLISKAEGLISEFGIPYNEYSNKEDRIMRTPSIQVQIDQPRQQEIHVFVMEATEGGVRSGYVLEASIPSLSDVHRLFYFRRPSPSDGVRNPIPSMTKIKGVQVSDEEMDVAENLLNLIHTNLSANKGSNIKTPAI